MESDRQRFWSKVQFTDACWLWTGWKNDDGYGIIRIGGKRKRAHRVAFEMEVGPIPDDLVPDHTCRIRACVRPDHLELVTPYENTLRGLPFRQRATTCKQGHLFTDDNTYLYRGRRHCRACKRNHMRVLRR